MLPHFHASTGTLTARLEDINEAAVAGATVIVTIVDRLGVALVTDADMPEGVAGTYSYTIAADLLPTEGEIYTATVTAEAGALDRSAQVEIDNSWDTD